MKDGEYAGGVPGVGEVYWRNPEREKAPAGKMLLLLTCELSLIKGKWEDGSKLVAWSYMPDVPDEIKEIAKRVRGY